MNFLKRATAFLLLIFFIFFAVGCGDQSLKAEELLKKAQDHYQKARTLVGQWEQLVNKESVDEAEKKLKQASDELKVAQKSLEEIKELNVPEWRKRHADLLIQAVQREIEVLEIGEKATGEMRKILKYADELKQSITHLESANNSFEKISNYLNQSKWKEVKSESEKAKSSLRAAKASAQSLSSVGIAGMKEYLKLIDLMLKMADASYRFSEAALKNNYSQAQEIAKEMDGYAKEIEKLNISSLDFQSFVENSLKPYLEQIEKKSEEAEKLVESAESLYRESVK